MTTFKTYLVGGAVRDELLDLPQKDQDYVVVGATPEHMIAAGFSQVGKDFPVFLHPKTKEEYALARVERKTAPGYHGFEVRADASVTLEEDLQRRDLTINAIAKDEHGNLVDPYNGQRDLKLGVLRHVSEAFAEDPVRILRVARFMARYGKQGFTVAPETMDLMKTMVANGEVDHLVPERVWAEMSKALTEPQPSAFLSTLRACGALARILPEVDALYGIEQDERWHPEIDSGIHTEMVIDQAAKHWPKDLAVAFCALTHDLGKALSPKDKLPSHHGHEEAGVVPLANMCQRLKVPSNLHKAALAVCVHHLGAHRVFEMRPGSVMELLKATSDGLRSPQIFETFVRACEADKRGRLGLEDKDYPSADHLRECWRLMKTVSAKPFADAGMEPMKIKERLEIERIKVIHQFHSPQRQVQKPNAPKTKTPSL